MGRSNNRRPPASTAFRALASAVECNTEASDSLMRIQGAIKAQSENVRQVMLEVVELRPFLSADRMETLQVLHSRIAEDVIDMLTEVCLSMEIINKRSREINAILGL